MILSNNIFLNWFCTTPSTTLIRKIFPFFYKCYKVTHINNFLRHFNSNLKTESIKKHNSFLEISKPSMQQPLILNYVWLRDHCHCDRCYNLITKQRNLDILDISLDIQPKTCSIEQNELRIVWDDEHLSVFNIDWLWNNNFDNYLNNSKRKYVLWNKRLVNTLQIAHIPLSSFMNNKDELQKLISSIIKFGVGFVQNVPPTLSATERVVQQVADVQRTFFGDMWEFSSNSMDHYDTAYTSNSLGAHTDGTYFSEAPGLQVFHCLHHDGEGGETLLVDGFRAAKDLLNLHPDSYKRLSSTPLEAEYFEPGKHYSNVGYVLNHHPITKELQQIRFNLYDRSSFSTIPQEHVADIYADLQNLAQVIKDSEGEWWIKLNPGTVMFIDNWRVLHGRAAYTGHRKIGGCYQSRADFLSVARGLGVLL